MARLDQIKDPGLRARVEEAHGQLRARQPSEAVRTLADTFLAMLREHPELLEVTTVVRGRPFPMVARWPALGANLVMAADGSGPPRIDFVRDRFALSEALTYYEFLVDTAVGQGI